MVSVMCCIRFIVVISFLDTSHFILAQWAIDDRGCRTPNEGVGDCIPIARCQPILNVLLQSFPLPEHIAEELQLYSCGVTETRRVKVCCPYDVDTLNYLILPSTRTQASKNSVFNHTNLALLPQECGFLQSSIKIIHGQLTDLFEFPWMALLSYRKGNEIDFRCAGTIINDRYILTAAHCITELGKTTLLGVRVGEYNISSPTDCVEYLPGDKICAEQYQDAFIEKVIPHPQYNSTTQANDIGLVRLAFPVNTSIDSVQPICLPTIEALTNLVFDNDKLTVTGWGFTEKAKKSEVLLKVDVSVMKTEDCQQVYKRAAPKSLVEIGANQICAGGVGGDSCGGDSGGPLQKFAEHFGELRYIQQGIVSFGTKFCGMTDIPGVYTRVDRYMEWILDNIEP
ncbi:melanization protease 1-like isoform X1 [Photinus pyralis]|nr:melanization protease 1-like isoform X1 [Photinus pyralis]